MSAPRVITFMSDYGLRDEFVGVCHGVIAGICPEARVIDLTHGVPRQDVGAGATVLAQSLSYMPVGVHLAVVDPGVGRPRRAVALSLTEGHLLVGPDNGLLTPAAEAGGGVVEAVEIGRSRFCLQPVSSTFHGRDVFAPVAAALAAGASLGDAGEEIDPASLVRLRLPEPRREGGTLVAHVRHVDGFGNVLLNAEPGDLGELCEDGLPTVLVEMPGGSSVSFVCGRTFGDVSAGEGVLYPDSSGWLALAVNRGDAAARFGLRGGDEVRLVRL